MSPQVTRDPPATAIPAGWANLDGLTLEEVIDILPERVEVVPGWTLEEILAREG